MKDYCSRGKHLPLYQMKANSLFYTTQLQEYVNFCDTLKLNYQFLKALNMMMHCHYKLSKDIFMHSVVII